MDHQIAVVDNWILDYLLAKASTVINKKTLIPILHTVKLHIESGRVSVSATDLEIMQTFTSDADTSEGVLDCCIEPAYLLTYLGGIKKTNSKVKLQLVADQLDQLVVNGTVTIPAFDVSEFPQDNSVDLVDVGQYHAGTFLEDLQYILPGLSDDLGRPVLTGGKIEVYPTGFPAFVATNGFIIRAVRVRPKGEGMTCSILVPGNTLRLLDKLIKPATTSEITVFINRQENLDAQIYAFDFSVHTKIGWINHRISGRAIIGGYPDYRFMIEKPFPIGITFTTHEMLENMLLIRRMLGKEESTYRPTHFILTDEKSKMGVVEDEFKIMRQVETVSKDLRKLWLSVNTTYMLEAVQSIHGYSFQLSLPEKCTKDNERMVNNIFMITEPEWPDRRTVVMPMRVERDAFEWLEFA